MRGKEKLRWSRRSASIGGAGVGMRLHYATGRGRVSLRNGTSGRVLRRGQGIDHPLRAPDTGGRKEHPADLLDRAAGAAVLRADDEEDAIDPGKGVEEHEALHLAVVGPAPVRPGEERPPDLDLPLRGIVAKVARGADYRAALPLDRDQSTSRRERAVEEAADDPR